MTRNEWTRRNNQDSSIPSYRGNKNKDDFDPDKAFLEKAKAEFFKSGGKIKIPVETS